VVVTVSVLVPDPPVIVLGLKLPLAPVGRPVTVRATLPVNPFEGATVMVEVAFDAAFTAAIEDEDNVKSAAGVTTSVTGAAYSTSPVPVPLKFRVYVPGGVLVDVWIVTVVVPGEDKDVGLKVAVTPVGRASFPKVTAYGYPPFPKLSVPVMFALEPAFTEPLGCVVEKEKPSTSRVAGTT
jgi:hypothetical protein